MYEPVPQIHIIRLQPLQTPINSFAYILRLIRKHARAVGQALDTEFGREKDLIIHHPLSITTHIYTTLSLSLSSPDLSKPNKEKRNPPGPSSHSAETTSQSTPRYPRTPLHSVNPVSETEVLPLEMKNRINVAREGTYLRYPKTYTPSQIRGPGNRGALRRRRRCRRA